MLKLYLFPLTGVKLHIGNKTKKMVFCFVFRSICTTFAADLA